MKFLLVIASPTIFMPNITLVFNTVTVRNVIFYKPSIIFSTIKDISFFLFFFLLAQQPPVGQGLLNHEVSRSRITSTTVGRTPLGE